jgi:PAS domain S-box-containing protein
MQATLKRLIRPPEFVDDSERTHAASLLNTILLMLTCGLIIGTVPSLFNLSQNQVGLLFFILGFVLLGVMRLILIRGYVRLTSWLLVVLSWSLVAGSMMQWEGPASPGKYYLITILLFSGLLLGRRIVLLVGIASICWVFVTYLLGINGMLPAAVEPITLESRTAVFVSVTIISTIILYVALGIVYRALRALRSNQQILQATLDDLQTTAVSRDYVDNILRSMSNMLVVVDPKHRILTVNPATLRRLQYTEEELLHQPFELICPPDLNGFDDQRRNDVTRQNLELIYRSKDGTTIPVALVRSLMRDAAGMMSGVIYIAQDITERKRAEAERSRAEAERQLNIVRYRALFEQTNDAVFILSMDGHHIMCNQRAADMLGYTTEELETLSYRDIVSPSEHDSATGALKRLLAGEKIPAYERTFRRRDGSTFPVEINVELVRDAEGQPLHIQSMVRDITDRKEIMRQLEYHASLINQVSDAVISTDKQNRIKSWNYAAEKIYGWKEAEVKGRLLNEIFPDQVDSEHLIKREYMQRGYWNSSQVHFSRDGKKLDILSSVALLRNGGSGFSGMVLVNHDITARKQAQDYLEALVSQLVKLRQVDVQVNSTLDIEQVMHYALDAAYQISKADAGFVLLEEGDQMRIAYGLGAYADHSDVVDLGSEHSVLLSQAMEWRQSLLIPDVSAVDHYTPLLPETRAQIVIPLMGKANYPVGALNLETSDESHFTMEVFNFLNLLASRLAASLENARLYREEQRRVLQLEELYAHVDSLEKIKTEIIHIASHDLRAPLAVIKGYLTLLNEDAEFPESFETYLTEMDKSLARMYEIITQILSIEKINELSEHGPSNTLPLNELVSRVVTSNRRQSQIKLQSMQTLIPDEPIKVRGDYMLLHEAVYNLVQNAVKYTPENGKLLVELCIEKTWAVFQVHDNGYGIPKDKQDQLFSPYSRVLTKETRDIEGTGMGLWLVKRMIERHGGEIIFQSVYGKGSTFGFRLPLVSDEDVIS